MPCSDIRLITKSVDGMYISYAEVESNSGLVMNLDGSKEATPALAAKSALDRLASFQQSLDFSRFTKDNFRDKLASIKDHK